MRYTLLIGILSLSFFGDACSQILQKSITVSANDVPIEEILEEISSDYGILFSYSKDHISFHSHATIHLENSSLQVVLDELIKDRFLEYKVIGQLVVFKKAEKKTNEKSSKTVNISAISPTPEPIPERIDPADFVFVKGIGAYHFSEGSNEPLIIPTRHEEKVVEKNSEYFQFSLPTNAYRSEMDFRIPKKIVEQAFRNIEDQFYTDPYQFEGFYREVHWEDDKAISLVDAIVNIYDKGYKVIRGNRNKLREKVRLDQVRATKNYMQDRFKSDFEDFNSLDGILKWNRIKYRDPRLSQNIGTRRYVLDSVIQTPEGPQYVISASIPSWRYTSKIVYYIEARTKTFRRVEYVDEANEGFYLPQQWRFSNDPSYEFKAKSALITYEFDYEDGKVFLKQCSEESKADIVNKRKKTVAWEFGCSRNLIITDKKKSSGRTFGAKFMDNNKSLQLQAGEYDGRFWSNYMLPPGLERSSEKLEALEKEFPEQSMLLKTAGIEN